MMEQLLGGGSAILTMVLVHLMELYRGFELSDYAEGCRSYRPSHFQILLVGLGVLSAVGHGVFHHAG